MALLLYGFLAGSNEDLFWNLYACSSVVFLMPYLLMCSAFLTLRRRHPDKPRPFRFPGSDLVVNTGAGVVGFVLAAAIFLFCYVPGEGTQWPVLLGALALIGVGELVIRANKRCC